MCNHRVKTCLVLGTAAAMLFAYASITTADPEKPAELPTELAKAAEQAYLGTVLAFENDVATLDDVYRWSRRGMKAELKANPTSKKPLLDHGERMRNFHEKIVALNEAGARGGETEKRNATTYYVEEAKFEILQRSHPPAAQ